MTPAEKKAQQRAALRALLAKPLLVADTDSDKLVLVRRHLPDLREWLSRETGWRLVADSETARLFKTATVLTDGWRGYANLSALGFDHVVINLSASPDPAHVLLPGPHRVASLVKRWLLGTYQGGISKAQLPYYLDEFTFRFNRRSSRARGLLFYRLIEQAAQVPYTPTAELYRDTGRGRRRTRR